MRADQASVAFAEEVLRRVQEDQNRADFLEFLYEMDDRGNPGHPHKNTYTGLFQEYAYTVGLGILEGVSKEWHTHDQSSILAALSEGGSDGRVEA